MRIFWNGVRNKTVPAQGNAHTFTSNDAIGKSLIDKKDPRIGEFEPLLTAVVRDIERRLSMFAATGGKRKRNAELTAWALGSSNMINDMLKNRLGWAIQRDSFLSLEKIASYGGFGVVVKLDLHATPTRIFELALKLPWYPTRRVAEFNFWHRVFSNEIDFAPHPNILRPIVASLAPPYLLMDWIDGGDLSLRVSNICDPAEFGRVTLGLLSAVSFCHASGIIHRDIKPQNIICVRDGDKITNVMLCDFGSARVIGEPIITYGTTSCYQSPEILMELWDMECPESDCFSCVIVILELLRGSHIVKAADKEKIVVLGLLARMNLSDVDTLIARYPNNTILHNLRRWKLEQKTLEIDTPIDSISKLSPRVWDILRSRGMWNEIIDALMPSAVLWPGNRMSVETLRTRIMRAMNSAGFTHVIDVPISRLRPPDAVAVPLETQMVGRLKSFHILFAGLCWVDVPYSSLWVQTWFSCNVNHPVAFQLQRLAMQFWGGQKSWIEALETLITDTNTHITTLTDMIQFMRAPYHLSLCKGKWVTDFENIGTEEIVKVFRPTMTFVRADKSLPFPGHTHTASVTLRGTSLIVGEHTFRAPGKSKSDMIDIYHQLRRS